jgi:tetratricopeptide (TPR) repeat protein
MALAGFCWALPALCQAVTFSAAVDRKRCVPGDQVILTVTVEGAFQSLPAIDIPPIDGIDIYEGGSSQSFSFVNGKSAASVTLTYILQVRADHSFTVPALELEVGDQAYRTQPIQVEVVRDSEAASPAAPSEVGESPPSQSGGPSSGTESGPAPAARGAGGGPGDELFITLTLDKSRVYLGEQVVLKFRFYRRVQLWENPQYTAPRTEGFWREDLPPERTYLQNVAGMRYSVTEIRYALFPTRPGRLAIEPAEVLIPSDPFDRFFSTRRRATGPVRLHTEHLTVEVLPLPQPQPAGFSGIVARQLSLKATVDRQQVPRGEPAVLKVSLVADGFLKSFEGLTINPVPGFLMHDSVENLDVDKSGPMLMSRLSVEKVLVPTEEGQFELAPVEIVTFNPERERYETARSETMSLSVTPSDLPVIGDQTYDLGRGEVERIAQDLAFIHTPSGSLRTRWTPLLLTKAGTAAWALPLLLLGLWRGFLVYAERAKRDPIGRRRRRALSRARRRLRLVRQQSESQAAMGLIVLAVTGYVADRLNRARASLTPQEVADYAARIGCPDAGGQLRGILATCEAARYGAAVAGETMGPSAGDGGAAPAELAEGAERALTRLDQVAGARRRSSPVSVHLPLLLCMGALALSVGALARNEPAEGSQAVASPDSRRLLAEGNQAYTAGEVDLALARYRELLAAGINDPSLHYNLGNAYARGGELGRAILCYLRAERLAPRQQDIKTNLAWVRAHTRDLELQADRVPLLVGQLLAGARKLSLDEWSAVLIVSLWVGGVLLAWGWYRGSFADNLRRLLLALAAWLCLVAVVVGWRWYDEQIKDLAVVVVPEVEVRSGPAETFPVVFRLHDGLTLTVRGRREGWARIGLGGEWMGWVPQQSVEPVRLPARRESTGSAPRESS